MDTQFATSGGRLLLRNGTLTLCVETILSMLASGDSATVIQSHWPGLALEEIEACVANDGAMGWSRTALAIPRAA
jgi:uncharacterized protein (DUF433 family)